MSSDALRARSLRAVWHPCTQMRLQERLPLVPIARGEGPWLVDHDGRRIFDGISSWWTNLFGHCHPRINAAVVDQLGRLEHVMLAGFTHAPAVELAERLAALVPGNLGHCFYASDGSSAVEIALKMSFHFWRNGGRAGKTGFVALEGSYHGETLGALSVTDVALYRDTYDPLLMRCRTVASPDARAAAPARRRRTSPDGRRRRSRRTSPSTTRAPPRSSSSRWCRAPRAWSCTTRSTCGSRGRSATATTCCSSPTRS